MSSDSEDHIRQREELEACQAVYGNDVSVHGNVDGQFHTTWKILITTSVCLKIYLPNDYPSRQAPTPKIQAPTYLIDARKIQDMENELMAMYQEDTEVAILWAENLRNSLDDYVNDSLDAKETPSQEKDDSIPTSIQRKEQLVASELRYAAFSTHHLLDHKPDNLLKTGHKCRLRGFYKFGTPGLGVCWCENQRDLDDFVGILKSAMPQKKFQIIFNREWDGQEIPSNLGWQETESAADFKKALEATGVAEADYLSILGIDRTEQSSAKTGRNGRQRKNGKK